MRRCSPSSARRGVLTVAGLGLLLASAAVAAALPAPPVAQVAGAGAALPEGVDTLLETLPPAQRAVLRQRVERWQSWTPEARAAFAERAASWDALPPLERGRRREAWQAWRALPPMQREQVGGMSREFAARPVDEREALRARFQALDTSVQRGWLLGPVLGADYWRLHGLLAQVPGDQRAPLLEVLAAMTAAQRAQLYVLVQRTPPQDRDALRRELVATPAGRRQQWLWEQLDR
ncbi:DUF3106 domain-containing protein [Marilutibacter spongiae]|uniref:DUF3106 domain-containing protein n=1 Tax=Marilutibacter spongiae TaxID=2025720 RepID=A0A7W3TMY4_9GAMM|nr:DUF3106 domain-containing protein [Lysobacter spongiae]MBB1061308.1 DUF3106 domain-containing protein [Lysobacter spongiae]